MDIYSIILIAIGLAMDAFSVSVTEGIILKKPRIFDILKIGFFFGGFQFLMPCIGYLLGSAFSEYITAFDHYIAFVLLGFIGGKMIYEAVTDKDEDGDIKNPLSFNTLLVLAVATSIDALAVGVTFATVSTPVPVIFAFLLIGVITYAISVGGVFIGSKFGDLLGNKAEILGGLVLIGIGAKILIEHLFF